MLPEGIRYTKEIQNVAALMGLTKRQIVNAFTISVDVYDDEGGPGVWTWCGVHQGQKFFGMGDTRQSAYDDLVDRWAMAMRSRKEHERSLVARYMGMTCDEVEEIEEQALAKMRDMIMNDPSLLD